MMEYVASDDFDSFFAHIEHLRNEEECRDLFNMLHDDSSRWDNRIYYKLCLDCCRYILWWSHVTAKVVYARRRAIVDELLETDTNDVENIIYSLWRAIIIYDTDRAECMIAYYGGITFEDAEEAVRILERPEHRNELWVICHRIIYHDWEE